MLSNCKYLCVELNGRLPLHLSEGIFLVCFSLSLAFEWCLCTTHISRHVMLYTHICKSSNSSFSIEFLWQQTLQKFFQHCEWFKSGILSFEMLASDNRVERNALCFAYYSQCENSALHTHKWETGTTALEFLRNPLKTNRWQQHSRNSCSSCFSVAVWLLIWKKKTFRPHPSKHYFRHAIRVHSIPKSVKSWSTLFLSPSRSRLE